MAHSAGAHGGRNGGEQFYRQYDAAALSRHRAHAAMMKTALVEDRLRFRQHGRE
jgi:hypothetical protein